MKSFYFYNNLLLEGLNIEENGSIEKYLPSTALIKNNTGSITRDELLDDTSNAIHEDFTNDAPNILNFLYYSHPELAYNPSNGLAQIYNVCEPLISAISNLFDSLTKNKESIKVKEMCFGSKWNAWELISKNLIDKKINLTASDLNDPTKIIPANFNKSKNLEIIGESCNLLNPIKEIVGAEKFDIIFSSYAFSSIWFKEDYHLTLKENGEITQTKMRTKLSENNINFSNLINELRSNQLKEPNIKDFDLTVLEESVEKFEINNIKYMEIIDKEYVLNKQYKTFNYPGGLIKKVQELAKQLKEGGSIVIGDVAYHGGNPDVSVNTHEFSGRVAKYKVEDYFLASKILESIGYTVSILPFKNLAEEYLEKGWENKASLRDVKLLNDNPNNCIMLIRK